MLALLDAHPLEEVEHAVLAYIEAAAGFLGTPELARVRAFALDDFKRLLTVLSRPEQQNSPAASAELTNASSGARRLPLSSLLNPTSSAPRSFPTYQQEPPTPPSDPNRAPRRRGLARWLVAPKPRRDGPAVAGVKRNRDGAEPAVDKGGRRRSIGGGGGGSSLSNGPGRPLMPTIVVEDWPESVASVSLSNPVRIESLTRLFKSQPVRRVRLGPCALPSALYIPPFLPSTSSSASSIASRCILPSTANYPALYMSLHPASLAFASAGCDSRPMRTGSAEQRGQVAGREKVRLQARLGWLSKGLRREREGRW